MRNSGDAGCENLASIPSNLLPPWPWQSFLKQYSNNNCYTYKYAILYIYIYSCRISLQKIDKHRTYLSVNQSIYSMKPWQHAPGRPLNASTCVGTVETGPWRRAPNMVARRAKRSKVERMLLTSAFGEPHWDKIKASVRKNILGNLWQFQEALESNNIEKVGRWLIKQGVLCHVSHLYTFSSFEPWGRAHYNYTWSFPRGRTRNVWNTTYFHLNVWYNPPKSYVNQWTKVIWKDHRKTEHQSPSFEGTLGQQSLANWSRSSIPAACLTFQVKQKMNTRFCIFCERSDPVEQKQMQRKFSPCLTQLLSDKS